MEKLSYKLPVFEGPLDLLLYLIRKNKLDICDIQISELLDQYMEQINAMKEEDMDVASEFLEMAARLVYMKTVSLLPKHEEGEKLRQELSGQLLEYQECKRIAELMAERLNYDIFVREAAEIEFDQTYRRHHTPMEIYNAYYMAVGHGKRFIPPSPEVFSNIVTHKIVSVSSRIIHVLRRLYRTNEVRYKELFADKTDKSDLIATFLAVLELVKGKRVQINGEKGNATVKLICGGVKKWRLKKYKAQ
ncbi:serine protease [Caproiciproducens galactitolivorans]|uniref:Segregation and condensation protein A n=1 Tax=Caproiciproducens galactitolivorans TaxID=642589 RepID=A0A4Z0YBF9_9FIRM|nr:segregation/condensation protein A [Caproiciproducens galactitolivorans]QEY34020.1 serine protease [Caproiciproducens galactitolivorans]TGJ76571.1 segregation and condensation protein A [Caproiciproducens galactitolivorans]